jgi:hypothetical protein
MQEREGGSCANSGSRHNSAQQLNGVNSHLCASSMNKSARSSPRYLGRRERAKMPEPPYAPLTFVSENVLTDTVYSLGIMFPLLLARFQEFDRREAEGVGDMPIATQDLGGTSELVRTQWFQRVLCHSRPPLPTRDSAGRRG